MAEKEIRFKLTADDKELKSSLTGAEKDAERLEKTAQKAALSLGDIAKGIAAAFAGSKLIDFFKSAVAEANSLERAMLKVTSAANAYGQSAAKARDAANSLAQDGFMSAQQAAESLSNLMAVGLNVDQAKRFVEAAKDITAFGNTIGDAAQATQDLTLGLLRGSALVIDNASPALKQLSAQYQQILDKSGKAAAAQYAYNQILKEAAKFQGDAARLMDTATGAQQRLSAAADGAAAAIGKALQPAITAVTRSLASAIESFTAWFQSLSPAAQTIAVIGTAVTALAPALATLIPLVKGLSAAFAGLLANPVALAIAGIAAAVTALGVAFANAQPSMERARKNYQSAKAELDALGAKYDALSKAQKRNAQQELELAQTKAQLQERAKALGLDFDDLIKKTGGLTQALKELEKAEKQAAIKREYAREFRRLEEAERELDYAARQKAALIDTGNLRAARDYDAQISESLRKIEEIRKKLPKLEDLDEKEKPKRAATEAAAVKREAIEVRFIETQKKIDEIKRKLRETEITIKLTPKLDATERERRIAQARRDAEMQIEAEKRELRAGIAEFLEERANIERLALEKRRADALRANEELFEAQLKEAKDNAAEIERLTREHEERKLQIARAYIERERKLRLQLAAETAQAAEKMVAAFAQIARAQNVGGAISGFGGLLQGASGLQAFAPAFGALGPIGNAIGAIGGIMSTLIDLFGESDEERRREAEAQKRRDEEAKAILELQANYQKNMLAQMEAQAALPFDTLQRELRLIDIQAQQRRLAGVDERTVELERLEARRAAQQRVLEAQASTIAGGRLFGDVVATPESLTEFLKARDREAILIRSAEAIISDLQRVAGQMTTTLDYDVFTQARERIGALGLSAPLQQAFEARLGDVLRGAIDVFMNSGRWLDDWVRSRYLEFLRQMAAWRGFDLRGDMGMLDALLAEVRADTSVAENMLALVEQQLQTQLEIERATKETAKNTSLQLENDRGAAFIDIAGGGLREFGNFLSVSPLTLAEQASAITLSSVAARAAQKTDVELLSELVLVSKDMRELLAEIALNTNRMAGNFGGLDEVELLRKLDEFKSRS